MSRATSEALRKDFIVNYATIRRHNCQDVNLCCICCVQVGNYRGATTGKGELGLVADYAGDSVKIPIEADNSHTLGLLNLSS